MEKLQVLGFPATTDAFKHIHYNFWEVKDEASASSLVLLGFPLLPPSQGKFGKKKGWLWVVALTEPVADQATTKSLV